VPAFGEEAPLQPSPLRVDETETNGPIVEEVGDEPPAPTGASLRSFPRSVSRPAKQRASQGTPKAGGNSSKDGPEQNKVWVKPKSERKVWLK
jgi:hypothetical protein